MCSNINHQGTKNFTHQFTSQMLKPHMSFSDNLCYYFTLLLRLCSRAVLVPNFIITLVSTSCALPGTVLLP